MVSLILFGDNGTLRIIGFVFFENWSPGEYTIKALYEEVGLVNWQCHPLIERLHA